jgi:hypothetical protein
VPTLSARRRRGHVDRCPFGQYGESRVVNHVTGHYAILQFKPYSFLGGVVADVEGKVYTRAGEPVLWLRGNWNRDAAIARSADGPWTVRPHCNLCLSSARPSCGVCAYVCLCLCVRMSLSLSLSL